MRLEGLRLRGFRRFENPTNVQLSGKLVALTGPNEAGKTSILKAIAAFADDEPIEPSDFTFNSDTELELQISFFLDQDDLLAANLTEPTWLYLTKNADGNITYKLHPVPQRDLLKRQKVHKSLRMLMNSRSTRRKFEEGREPIDDKAITSIMELASLKKSYTQGDISSFVEGADLFDTSDASHFPKYARVLKDDILDLVEFEKEHKPYERAIAALEVRTPTILTFSQEYRDIDLPYNINLYNHQTSPKRPSKPLEEILRQADLDIPGLLKARLAANQGTITGMITAANEKLASLSRGVWSQSDATLVFTLDGSKLDLVVENREGFDTVDRFTDLKMRSDGYRQFVALQVFAFLQKEKGSILVIDELGQHLHYDAQADLVQLLQNEPTIQKVIYTTHSAGALPEDLGTGVRLVHWNEKNPKTSSVVNKFWNQDDHAGFRPLLFGMGAATLAFFPTRKALIGEGPTELLLLPKLLKEAMAVEALDFQIIHGLANISPKGLPALSSSNDGVAYLVDNDEGGRAITKSLVNAGVQQSSIFSLKEAGPISTVEDLLERTVWISAVNRYIDQYGDAIGVSTITSAPMRNRIGSLPAALKKQKISFAYNVLDMVAKDPDISIVSSNHKTKLKALGHKIFKNLHDHS